MSVIDSTTSAILVETSIQSSIVDIDPIVSVIEVMVSELLVEANNQPCLIEADKQYTIISTGNIVDIIETQAGQGPRGLIGPSGGEDEAVYAKRVDFADDATIYRGEAAVGTTDAQPLWRIRRITLAGDGDVTEEWAGGSAAFDKSWDDRATLGYS